MSCNKEPHQLELDLPDTNQFDRFQAQVCRLISSRMLDELCTELRNWARFNDFPLVASWCRRILRDFTKARSFHHAGVLLECFSVAFRGDLVGHIGRDLLTPPLHSNHPEYRLAAINVLGRWLEYDEDGMWLEMAEQHLEREQDEGFRSHLWDRITELVDEEYLEFDDDEPDPLIEEFFEIRRECDMELRGTFPTTKLPDALERIANIPQSMTLGILESLSIGNVCVQESEWGFFLSSVAGGNCLKVWDPDGAFALSVEPTATEDRWLVFAYLR